VKCGALRLVLHVLLQARTPHILARVVRLNHILEGKRGTSETHWEIGIGVSIDLVREMPRLGVVSIRVFVKILAC
jgi:hypothetical protein